MVETGPYKIRFYLPRRPQECRAAFSTATAGSIAMLSQALALACTAGQLYACCTAAHRSRIHQVWCMRHQVQMHQCFVERCSFSDPSVATVSRTLGALHSERLRREH